MSNEQKEQSVQEYLAKLHEEFQALGLFELENNHEVETLQDAFIERTLKNAPFIPPNIVKLVGGFVADAYRLGYKNGCGFGALKMCEKIAIESKQRKQT